MRTGFHHVVEIRLIALKNCACQLTLNSHIIDHEVIKRMNGENTIHICHVHSCVYYSSCMYGFVDNFAHHETQKRFELPS